MFGFMIEVAKGGTKLSSYKQYMSVCFDTFSNSL